MEYYIYAKDSVFPCEVIIDEDNGRYMIRKADRSGEFFNSPEQLVKWIMNNWHGDQFLEKEKFEEMLEEILNVFPVTCP